MKTGIIICLSYRVVEWIACDKVYEDTLTTVIRYRKYYYYYNLKKIIFGGKGQRERERERIPSRLHTVGAEPNTGLELTNGEIMT